MFTKQQGPLLALEDLGIDLEEDSTDLTEEEAASAIDTDDLEDLTAKTVRFIRESQVSGVPKFERRQRAGILFSRVSFEDGPKAVFRIEWMRKGL